MFSRHLSASDGTEAIPEEQLLSCGASDCLMATASTNSTQRPSQTLIYTLLGIYTGMCSQRVESQGQQTELLPVVKKSIFPKYKYSCKMCSPGLYPGIFHVKSNTAEQGCLTVSYDDNIIFLLQSSI